MSPVLRKMTAADLSQTAVLELRCFSDPWSERLLSELLESSLDEAWVLADGEGTIVSYANFRFLAGEGELMRIAVLPEYRGRGYSRRLMERLEISARERKIAEMTLEVRAGNETAINLYRSFGFQAEAVRRGYYRNPTEDAVIMWRRGLLGIPT